MTDAREVICRPHPNRGLWFILGLGAAGAILAAVRVAYLGRLVDPWAYGGLLVASVGFACLHGATARVSADAYGLHSRTLLRRRSLPWHDVADLRVYLQHGRHQDIRRVSVVLRNGRSRRLPLPWSGSIDVRSDFDAELDALRAVHRRYGAPESSHVPVISYRTAGRGSAVWLVLCALLLAGAGLAAWFVPIAESGKPAWRSATPCTTETAEPGECLTTVPAVIARTEVGTGKERSWLYFADGRPLRRLAVSQEGAQGFQPGDSVELAIWRSQVREVAGEHHVWREHFTGAGELAVIAAACALAAGYPGARVLLRLRGRRLPDDEVLPSALPFAGALVGTSLWLLPLCYLHPASLLASPVAITWAAAGSLASLGLFTWAWRATRVLTPEEAAAAEVTRESPEEVFLAARFLEHTDYNPNGFGTHIVLGDGPPAVTPHPGPDRFAAKRIPVERLTVKEVRRARGGDGDTVPRSWHIAELDDAGRPVRLAAAPADLTRIIRKLGAAGGAAG
ncbi:PH domain-containing protein [Streptomyces sp. HNM0645]|uniref:PH domain-containing protein n=1 Tax=Streptomyces sp. HNM0645 TaxID=2782343 RepID=UPI0024B63ECD|nr:PH domain-containing protein [Streptomyces sp. HNM0645]MDI9885207.1 PH domain-containing protein [Streptomyces sp. HNM0645]